MEERHFHPLDYVSVLQRRKWWLIVPIALSFSWPQRWPRCCP